jgi:cystathionine beta-lyase/cystathionine gamma-synthase
MASGEFPRPSFYLQTEMMRVGMLIAAARKKKEELQTHLLQLSVGLEDVLDIIDDLRSPPDARGVI